MLVWVAAKEGVPEKQPVPLLGSEQLLGPLAEKYIGLVSVALAVTDQSVSGPPSTLVRVTVPPEAQALTKPVAAAICAAVGQLVPGIPFMPLMDEARVAARLKGVLPLTQFTCAVVSLMVAVMVPVS
jgi:hypothetical protein